MRRLALVVPCFNEERRLDVGAFTGARVGGDGTWELELVFVDDGSRDGTRRVLEGIQRERREPTRILPPRPNAGKAEAVRVGILDALTRAPDAVGFWDADLATPFSELAAFVDVLRWRPEVEIVLGARVKLMGRTIERRAWRHYVGRVFATAASVALDLAVYDTQCGAKVLRTTPAIARVFSERFAARWIFDVEILARFLATRAGPRAEAERAIYELPLRNWVDVEGSKLKAGDWPKAAIDLAMIRARYPPRRS
jgi:glycosyltransferase involved in cell wall biosynthesis